MTTKIPIIETSTSAGGESASAIDPRAAREARRAAPMAVGARGRGRILVETYGCQMNVSDTELMFGILAQAGFGRAESVNDADVILLNTCAIRDNAEQRVWARLAQLASLKRRHRDLLVGVTGCMAKHVGEGLAHGRVAVDVVASPDAYRSLPELIEQARDHTQLNLAMDRSEHYQGIDPVRRGGVGGWVTIMRGCDKFCTFCIVPYVRGRERSVPDAEVVRQVEELAREGFREVTLLGQTVNAYRYKSVGFAGLLGQVASVPGIERVRFTSPHPSDFDAPTLEVMAAHPKIMKHVHLPVQSGSDRVLTAMRRGYTRRAFLDLVERMRAMMPAITFTTDFIVGFPGETAEDYELTLELAREVGFESAFMFMYSERDGTVAAREQPETVSPEEKRDRLTRLIELQESISAARNRTWIGRQVEVLVEGTSRKDASRLFGKSRHGKTVIVPADHAIEMGALVWVRVEDATSHTLFGTWARPGAE